MHHKHESDSVHSGRLTWNLRIPPWKRKIIFQFTIFRFYVHLRGCTGVLFRWSKLLFFRWSMQLSALQSPSFHRSNSMKQCELSQVRRDEKYILKKSEWQVLRKHRPSTKTHPTTYHTQKPTHHPHGTFINAAHMIIQLGGSSPDGKITPLTNHLQERHYLVDILVLTIG